MAMRRSRLKAVAYVPVRRKPGISQELKEQQEPVEEPAESTEKRDNVPLPEKSKDATKAGVAADDTLKENNALINENTEETEAVNDSKPEEPKSEIEKDVPLEKVPSADIPSAKDIPPAIKVPRFGRRLKPVVCLPVRKEKSQSSDNDSKIRTEPVSDNDKLSSIKDDTSCVQTVNEKNSEGVNINSSTTHDPLKEQEITPSKELEPKLNNALICNEVVKKPDVIKNDSADKVSSNVQNSPVKSVQRPVFAKPNVNSDSPIRRTSVRVIDEQEGTMILPQRTRHISESSITSAISQNVQFKELAEDKKNAANLKRKRPKSNDLTKKLTDARREFYRRHEKVKPDRSSLKMIDLIFYNPSTNPMESKVKVEKKENRTEEELLSEEAADDPDAVDNPKSNDEDDEDVGKMPVPQVKIGLNGEIILDEKSLVIETTDAKRGREDLLNSVPVFEDKSSRMSYYCKKTKKTKDWIDSETKRFYKALNTIGTDFLLMQQLFPSRTRLELKNKFKREEKLNRSLIDKALNNPSEFDIDQLEKDFANERKMEEEEIQLKLQKKAEGKVKQERSRAKSSFLLREMTECETEEIKSKDSSNTRNLRKDCQKSKKLKEAEMLCEKLINGDVSDLETNNLTEPNLCNESEPETEDINQNTKSKRLEEADFLCQKSSPQNPTMVPIVKDYVEFKSVKRKSTEVKKSKRRSQSVIVKKPVKKSKNEVNIYTPDAEPTLTSETTSSDVEEDSTITKTISDEDFFQLLATNVKNMKESKIKVQVTEDYSSGDKIPEKKIEIIFDEVPSITLKEIEDQNVTVLADCNSNNEAFRETVTNETSVIVRNPNVVTKEEPECRAVPEKEPTASEVIENENVMLVIDENEMEESKQCQYYQYTMVEEQEVAEDEIPESPQSIDVENDELDVTNAKNPIPLKDPTLLVCKSPDSNDEKMYLGGLSAGSFVLMASDSVDQNSGKKFSVYMISEKSQSDGTSVLASMPVMLPPELVQTLTQELNYS